MIFDYNPQNWCAMCTKSLLEGCTARCHFGLPCFYLRLGSVVGTVSTARAGEVLEPWLRVSGCEKRRRSGSKGRRRTAFHGGVRFCMATSCGGGSFRMWESHECHSAGTCEALYSCYEKGSISGSAYRASRAGLVTNLGKVDPTMTT